MKSGLGVKVFAATKAREREFLGETITDWMRTHPECEVIEKQVTQSSDAEFHCLAITLFYRFDLDVADLKAAHRVGRRNDL